MGSLAAMSVLALGAVTSGASDPRLDALNVIWDSPSTDHHGSMPLGNGEIGVNAWVDPAGDLQFYLGRVDSLSAGGQLLKVGKVRVHLDPNPLADATSFRQELNLARGEILVSVGGANPARMRLWVDANHPVVQLDVDSGRPLQATATLELWRKTPAEPPGDMRVSDPYSPRVALIQPDVVLHDQPNRIGWYHHNAESFGARESMAYQGLDGYPSFVDPMLHRTFGGMVTADGGRRLDDETLQAGPERHLSVRVYSIASHPSTPESWLADMDAAIRETEALPDADRLRAHGEWWEAFWDRSFVYITQSGQAAPPPSPIPANGHAVRVGFDQSGQNIFQGEFGRVAVYATAYDETRCRQLAQCPHDAPSPEWSDPVYSARPEPGTELPGSADWGQGEGITIEAWIRTGGPNVVGRIIDKITPGGSDGFLLDTHPGNTLRLIVGRETMAAGRSLPANGWVHVAASISGRGIRLYQDGQIVAERGTGSDDDALTVSRAYALQRFINACAGRGRYPIKFNGSIFTVPHEGRGGDADYRAWGPGYWWQNTRLPYISMCASGDFDLMQPLFRMYVDDIFPLCEYRVQRYFGYDGAYFVECMHPWGAVFPDTYGHEAPMSERQDPLQSSGWHKWEWVAGPELVCMMLDYGEYSGDWEFIRTKALRVAHSVARFFENYYRQGADGKLVMHPSQALETWWDVTNPMPEVAGLRAIAERILGLPDGVATGEQLAFWRAFLAKLPELPLRETPDGLALAPGREFAQKSNVENPELYAVFPFRLVGVGRPHLEWGINALRHRWDSGAGGWRQDDIFMAYLGLADEARANVVQRASTWHTGSRFPAFWGPNYDWIPDQDHGGVLLKAVQSLLMQTDGRAIYLSPAWPKGWNAEFKLHAPYETVVEAKVRDGEIRDLKVTPKERERDVVVLGR